jgi:N-acetylmuramic acid 6-phosphate etherase
MVKIDNLQTEKRNDKTMNLDELSASELLTIMNEEDQKVPLAVKKALPQITEAVEAIIKALKKEGRLIFMGAGTSGRLGVIDAAECMPTFGTTDEVIGLIAGGPSAFLKAKEGAEDSQELGVSDLKENNLSNKDVVVGLAASGRTPYVIGALDYATQVGAVTVSVSCNKDAEMSKHAQIAIEVDNGPEVLTGSTRLKAGTSQKLILNMLSTASMVGIGKVFGNLMVDVKATNLKLVERSKRIIMMATECDYETAEKYYDLSDNYPKAAIVMILTGCSKEDALKRLDNSEGFVRQAVK